jgi:plastocyanin
MKLRHAASLAAGMLAATSGIAQTPGPNAIKFPEKYGDGVLYATVDRHDIKQYRELWSSKSAVDAVKAGKPIPHGTVLTLVQYKAKVDDKGVPMRDANGRFQKGDLVAYTVMQKDAGFGSGYTEDIRNGDWEYQVFNAEKKVNDKANLKGCFQCHKPHAGQDYVISLARLTGTAPGAKITAKKGMDSVAIADFLFGPEKLEVPKGTYVRWTNVDDSPHQVTVTSANGLRSDVLLKGQTAFMKFDQPGTYDYACGLHPGMKGKVEVK